jgi:hypothetical protein
MSSFANDSVVHSGGETLINAVGAFTIKGFKDDALWLLTLNPCGKYRSVGISTYGAASEEILSKWLCLVSVFLFFSFLFFLFSKLGCCLSKLFNSDGHDSAVVITYRNSQYLSDGSGWPDLAGRASLVSSAVKGSLYLFQKNKILIRFSNFTIV